MCVCLCNFVRERKSVCACVHACVTKCVLVFDCVTCVWVRAKVESVVCVHVQEKE